MRNHVKFLLVVFSVAALSSFLVPDRATSEQQDVTGSDHATIAEPFNEEAEIVLSNAGGNIVGRGNPWLLLAQKDDDDKDGRESEGEEEEKDDKGGASGGFDRHWDVVCCG